jgi:hypothetical protein
MSENNTKAKYINNSLIWHIRYKVYIWYRKFPLIIERLLGINQRYILMRLNYLESQVKINNIETTR